MPRQRTCSAPRPASPAPSAPPAPVTDGARRVLPARLGGSGTLARRFGGLRAGRLLPSPLGTPFTFGYAAVLAVTSYLAEHMDPASVHALHQASSTDVAHLVRHPVFVLIASALWIVGGVASPYAVGSLLILTALERRTGTARAAGVFLLGHAVATLVTEVPVGLAVLAGRLPAGSLHRLDYGISYGVAASVGSLAGLLSPWLRLPLLTGLGSVLAADLIAFDDPMANWGHLIALAIGVATWPLVRERKRAREGHGASPPGRARRTEAPDGPGDPGLRSGPG
ncbi:rhomboid-like protein [Streptomyces sp. NPDC002685]|uniref:rhomboid-like protein n=1 Tax=Streptomyces sp. NPDC002685 TaxID=3154540 RepID=UPI003322D583